MENLRARLEALCQILCCPDCRGPLRFGDNELPACQTCYRVFDVTDGILILLPLNSLPDARQNDPDYQKWCRISGELLTSYFENGNRVFNIIHHSSHRVAARMLAASGFGNGWTLDLGCGTGAHYGHYPDLERVIGLDISLSSLRMIRRHHPDALLVQGDVYRLPFASGRLARIVSIYNLEHIYHIQAAVEEIRRALSDQGDLIVGLPCEGGLAWNGGRKLTSERHITKTYGLDYRKAIAIDHCNRASDVLRALAWQFQRLNAEYFPFSFLPSLNFNLTVTGHFRKIVRPASQAGGA